MRFMTLSALASSWLLLAPAVWAQRPASAVTAAAIGFVSMVLSPMGIVWRPARAIIAVGGLVLGLSNFFIFDGVGTAASNAVVGLCLLCAGMGLGPRSHLVAAAGLGALPVAQSKLTSSAPNEERSAA